MTSRVTAFDDTSILNRQFKISLCMIYIKNILVEMKL